MTEKTIRNREGESAPWDVITGACTDLAPRTGYVVRLLNPKANVADPPSFETWPSLEGFATTVKLIAHKPIVIKSNRSVRPKEVDRVRIRIQFFLDRGGGQKFGTVLRAALHARSIRQ